MKKEAKRVHAEQNELFSQRRALDLAIEEKSKQIIGLDALVTLYTEHPSIISLMSGIVRQVGVALGETTAAIETAKHVLAEASMPVPATEETLDPSFVLPEDGKTDEAGFAEVGDRYPLSSQDDWAREVEPAAETRTVTVDVDDEAGIETVVRLPDPNVEQGAPTAAEIFDEGTEPVAKKAGRAKKPDRLAELEDAVSDRVLSRVQRIISRCAGDRNEGVFSVSKNGVQHDLRSPDIRMAMELLALRGTLEILPYHDQSWIKFRLLKR